MGNYSFLETESDPMVIIDSIIKATEGVYPLGVLVAIFIVGFIALKSRGRDTDEILIYLGAFEFLLTGFFIIIGRLDYYFLMLPVGILFAGIVFNRLK